jgi:ribosomal protein S18 acetylase RimI-like enzyme
MIEIHILNAAEARHRIPDLAHILHECVTKGASVGFMNPFGLDEATRFFSNVSDSVERGDAVLFVATETNRAVGTCQLWPVKKSNQPHRVDVAKLLVDPRFRKQGIGQMLLHAADAEIMRRGFKLATLDTARGTAERLYERAGYQQAGIIPNFALWPDGGYCDTVLFYKSYD